MPNSGRCGYVWLGVSGAIQAAAQYVEDSPATNDEEDAEQKVWVKMETQRAEEAGKNLGVTGRWEESVAMGKFKWAGHMVRRGSERRTQRVIMAQETQKRASAGHPKIRWHNIIEELLGRGWQETAEDREWWRYFSNEVPNWIAAILD